MFVSIFLQTIGYLPDNSIDSVILNRSHSAIQRDEHANADIKRTESQGHPPFKKEFFFALKNRLNLFEFFKVVYSYQGALRKTEPS